MKQNTVMKKIMVGLLVLGMTAGISACSKNNSAPETKESQKETETTSQSETPETTTADTESESLKETAGDLEAAKTEYPLSITTYGSDGNELVTVYEKAPEKALAVYQGSIETLLALGLEDHMIAAAGLDNEVSDDLKAAFDKVEYLTEFAPSLETVTMLDPDFIFSWGSYFKDTTLGEASNWVDNGTNIYINSNTRRKADENRTLKNEFTDLLNIGKIFDVQEKAQAIVDEMQNEIDRVTAAASDMENRPTVMIVEFLGDSITNYGASSLGGDMVKQLGGVLAKEDSSDNGQEDIISLDPDVIFVVYMAYSGDDPEQTMQDNLNKILEDETYASLSAVKNGRVLPIMLGDMYASGVRTKDGIKTFAEGLYPDIK